MEVCGIEDKVKRIVFALLFALAVVPLSAQEKPEAGDGYIFRFVADKDVPFSPWSGNGKEPERLPAAIEENRAALDAGNMFLCVTSYGTDGNSEQARLAAEKAQATPYHFALRANLLRWATLTPDLGIEWRINRNVGVLVNGSWTSWSWDNRNRRYALWEVAPEVRRYLGVRKAWYVGAMFKAGSFNYKFSETGRQGDLSGGGITGGCQLKLNNSLSMDFSLGLGYVNADMEKYKVIDGVRVRQGDETKHWFGPIHAGVTLVWNIF